MSDEERQDEQMKAFEAALASLRPRADGLDDSRRQRLADEARRLCFSITSEPQEPPLSTRGRKSPVMLKHNLRACSNPVGHRFLCVYCGIEAPTMRVRRRWPAAFAVATSVAAVLLVMLIADRRPPATDHRVDTAAVGINTASEPESGLAEIEQYRPVPTSDETCYLNLRDQVLRYGVESWKSPVAAATLPTSTTERPLTYREQLDCLLKQQDLRGS